MALEYIQISIQVGSSRQLMHVGSHVSKNVIFMEKISRPR